MGFFDNIFGGEEKKSSKRKKKTNLNVYINGKKVKNNKEKKVKVI